MRKLLLLLAAVAAVSVTTGESASAEGRKSLTQRWAHNFAMDRPWHGGYYNQTYGQPMAVVVPPTAHMRTNYSWGVGQNTMYPIHHQFGRSAPGTGAAAPGTFRPTPAWPSHTDQFGYYYIRAPW
ncbi:hypothetical protein [Roseiconus lacunae]|uniref:Uncharacterized protein n=1 Tax=Roseiconus lacunae TaxID=2605694 RepID=A0ABT7PKA7_9BACT|nr:hypothetical protein [Roseiconus lacunae]MCD0461034.1 hypothetical protein [Roseiconus lacunae]MDM4016937.1 hypothetical protein [Roseiconus lacunae]WRQ48873.1 hypothetical protein U8335_18120 [Stieleria sp. HD01]